MRQTPETRVRILDAAERLFAEGGFDATSTSSIATQAGVPKGLLFYYFPTKSDLLRALVSERLDLGPIDANALIAPGDPVRALLNLSKALEDIQAESAVLRVIVWREQRTHPDVRAKLREHRRQVQAVAERVLRGSMLRPDRRPRAALRCCRLGGDPVDPAAHRPRRVRRRCRNRPAGARRADLRGARRLCSGVTTTRGPSRRDARAGTAPA